MILLYVRTIEGALFSLAILIAFFIILGIFSTIVKFINGDPLKPVINKYGKIYDLIKPVINTLKNDGFKIEGAFEEQEDTWYSSKFNNNEFVIYIRFSYCPDCVQVNLECIKVKMHGEIDDIKNEVLRRIAKKYSPVDIKRIAKNYSFKCEFSANHIYNSINKNIQDFKTII